MNTHSRTPRRRTKQSLSKATVAGAALIGLLAANSPLQAADGTWTGAGANGNWSNSDNWSAATIPGSTSVTNNPDTATFNNGGISNLPVVIDLNRNLRTLLFDTASAGAFTIGSTGGNAIRLTATGTIAMTASVVNAQVVNAPLSLYGNAAFLNDAADSAATLTIGGAISRQAAATGANVLTLGGSNAGTNVVSGQISNGGASNTLAVTKSGAGTWRLTGNNSYSGVTTVSGGTLEIGHDSALGTSSILLQAATLSAVGGSRTIANNLTLANPASAIGGSENLAISGTVTQTGGSRTLTVNNSGTTELSGPVFLSDLNSGGRNLTIAGSGLLIVSGDIADYNGVSLGANGFIKAGDGRVVLSGNNTYTGATNLQSGVLEVDASGLPTTSLLRITTTNGGVLQSSGTFNRTVGNSAGNVQWFTVDGSGGFAARGGDFAIQLNGGTSAIAWGSANFVGNNGAGAFLAFGSTSADSVVDFQNGLGLTSAARTIRVTDNVNSTTDKARISGQITSTTVNGGIVKEGDGILELSHGNNTYQGATVVNAGTLLVSGTLANTSSVTVASGAILGGSGRINSTISGAGAINPGNSPGTLTATALNGDAGMDFNFEFTSGADDILRLTNGTTPFAGTGLLDSDNTISLYLDAATWTAIENGGSLVGGFYTDAGDFSSSLVGATIAGYYWNGSSYTLITTGSFTVDMVADATFVPGGYVSEFTFTPVPEPGAWTLVTAAGLALVVMRRRNNRV